MKDLFKNSLTIPNFISLIRILIIPVFAVLFIKGYVGWALVVLAISGISDFLDGTIARKYSQISELGKILDPVADKLTQVMVAVLLFFEFRNSDISVFRFVSWTFLVFLAKELIMLVVALVMLIKQIKPVAAKIYGKIATAAFYTVMVLIVAFGPKNGVISRYYPVLTIPETVLVVLLIITVCMSIFAFINYGLIMLKQFKSIKSGNGEEVSK